MKRLQSRKGSALLIVLGFLSFMVVSAVAFAVWMRTERLPSSVLRRSVATRHLVKAALAQAMSRVDDAVRSHVFPGAWNTNDQSAVYRDGNGSSYDWWEARVFMPPDPDGENSGSDPNSRYAPISETVSVLNMEALGYLPPAIANDVRLLARSSWAAKWDYFNFDAGRYAFCAVNVSDLLDVNKLKADAPRTSASPVSLAPLFRKNDNDFSNIDTSNAEVFDKFVHSNREGWKEAPLVSMMDYSLAIGKNSASREFESPFYNLAKGITANEYFYERNSADDGRVKGAARQPFITGSWFPTNSIDALGKSLDISLYQPFEMSDLKNSNMTLLDVFNKVAKGAVRPFWDSRNEMPAFKMHGLSNLDIFTLYDYLDEDSVPLSLCMPCAERVPMIAALQPAMPLEVKLVKGDARTEGDRQYTDWKISVRVLDGQLGALVVFPFGDGQTPPSGCTVEAFARLVFVRGAKDLTEPPKISMRNNEFARKFKPMKDNEWTGNVTKQYSLEAVTEAGLERPAIDNCLVVTLPAASSQAISIPVDGLDEKGQKIDLKFKVGEFVSEAPFVSIVQKLKQNADGTPGSDPDPNSDSKYKIGMLPFDESGNLASIDTNAEMNEEELTNIRESIGDIYPYLFVWARIKYDGKTVDMVPATVYDDQLNGINNAGSNDNPVQLEMFGTSFGMVTFNGGTASPSYGKLPIMRFGCKFQNSERLSYDRVLSDDPTTTLSSDGGNAWSPKAFVTVDPRFNWAPEDWFAYNGSEALESVWYRSVFDSDPTLGKSVLDYLAEKEYGSNVGGRGDRAQDPYLFVSNQGYLQSPGELCFLPRLSVLDENLDSTHNVLGGGDRNNNEKFSYTNKDVAGYDGVERSIDPSSDHPLESMPSWRSFWKSYQSVRTNPKTFELGANMYRRGLVGGIKDFCVNPFTQSHEVMLAALAGTPLNYWAASTNTVFDSAVRHQDWGGKFSGAFKDWTFTAGTHGPKMTGDDVRKIATFLQHRFEDLAAMVQISGNPNEHTLYALRNLWADMFDALDWSGKLGLTVQDVYNDLNDYYRNGGSGKMSYSKIYGGSESGYGVFNRIVSGSDSIDGVVPALKFDTGRAIYKDDLSKSADPLRGETANGGQTTSGFLDELTNVDRMFLHSFWRDCFANRQQLFLIFVRAESTALGGTGEGTPAQQGGRAVALVWRDPLPVVEDNRQLGPATYEDDGTAYQRDRHPHKMRILFYRQFD